MLTHISLLDLVPLVRVIQHVDWQVWDGNSSRSSECNQQHQNTFTFFQWQVQFVCVLFTKKRQVNGTPREKNKQTQNEKIVDFVMKLTMKHTAGLIY